jgi:hypothetical protein
MSAIKEILIRKNCILFSSTSGWTQVIIVNLVRIIILRGLRKLRQLLVLVTSWMEISLLVEMRGKWWGLDLGKTDSNRTKFSYFWIELLTASSKEKGTVVSNMILTDATKIPKLQIQHDGDSSELTSLINLFEGERYIRNISYILCKQQQSAESMLPINILLL